MSTSSPIFVVDEDRCTRCGLCASDCPARIVSLNEESLPHVAPENEASCILCQHCLAICPEAAVAIRGLVPSNSLSSDSFPTLDQMDRFVRGRRSTRQYRDENVDPKLLDRLLDGLAHAPTGVNRRELTFTVIQDKAVLSRVRRRVLDGLRDALKSGRLLERNAELAQGILAGYDDGRDDVFRGAPHLLIVSAPPSTPCPETDVPLTLAYFELLAQSAGLGTVWCGYIHRILESLPELKSLFALPDDHIYYPMLFGVPAVAYARTVQRTGSALIKRVSVSG